MSYAVSLDDEKFESDTLVKGRASFRSRDGESGFVEFTLENGSVSRAHYSENSKITIFDT